MRYNHTQIGYLIIWIIVILVVYFAWILTQTGMQSGIIIIMSFIIIILLSFTTLKVTIYNNHLNIKFGYGIYQKSIPLKDIQEVTTVKNKWYYGWGIKYKFKPLTVIYNVSGFDAVQIKTKENRYIRIGTDEPQKLEQAIKTSLK